MTALVLSRWMAVCMIVVNIQYNIQCFNADLGRKAIPGKAGEIFACFGLSTAVPFIHFGGSFPCG